MTPACRKDDTRKSLCNSIALLATQKCALLFMVAWACYLSCQLFSQELALGWTGQGKELYRPGRRLRKKLPGERKQVDLLESQVKAQEKRIQVLDKKVGSREKRGQVTWKGEACKRNKPGQGWVLSKEREERRFRGKRRGRAQRREGQKCRQETALRAEPGTGLVQGQLAH